MLEKGTRYKSRGELVEALEKWIAESDDETIGDTSFARAPWLSFDSSAGVVDLNADTNRQAVERMLQKGGGDEPWHVIENRKGNINKVVFHPSDSHEGWYAYLRESLSAPQELK